MPASLVTDVDLPISETAITAAPAFAELVSCISVVHWIYPVFLTNSVFWQHFSIFTFDPSPFLSGIPKTREYSEQGWQGGTRREGLTPRGCVWHCHGWWDTSGDTAGTNLQGQFEWGLLTHPPSPQYLLQHPEAGTWATFPVEETLWLKNSWRSHKRWANCTPSRRDGHGIDGSLGRTWTPYYVEGATGRSCPWTHTGCRMPGSRKLESLVTEGKALSSLCSCALTEWI